MINLNFRPTMIAAATTLVFSQMANAGAGLGDAYDVNNNPFVLGTYFAQSPSGARLWTGINPDGSSTGAQDSMTGAPDGYDPANRKSYAAAIAALYPNGTYPGTGTALRKFVDPLPLPEGHALATMFQANAPHLSGDANAAKYIPVGKPVKWTNPQGVATGDDYYEIAVVEYSEKFHSDLKNPTTLRGYVQIDQFATYGTQAAPAGWVSKAIPLTYPDGSPIMVNKVDANGKLIAGAQVQAKAVDAPHYLGPVLTASRNVPTRVKFINLLPVGRAETKAGSHMEFKHVDPNTNTLLPNGSWQPVSDTQVTNRHGDLFLPVDPSVPGAGFGPDGANTYPQNRALIHLHGGDNPWISDGTPHQWITPAGELQPLVGANNEPLSVKSLIDAGQMDPTMQGEFTRGVNAINVPDMNDPGPGAMTYYFPNGQSARMEWYHDHSVGLTRLNVYAGMASAYLLTDSVEQDMINTGKLPGADATIPLVLQDKTFVPADIALQDARWSTTAWGAESAMWYPHVYETVQDPLQATNFNSVGRWHWGPWFWPVFPSLYELPSGNYNDVSLTPEAWMDTPVVNGVAYPTLTVEPKPYRFRVLNASNDRAFAFNFFVADMANASPAAHADGSANYSEMKMVPINSWLSSVCAAGVTRTDGTCTPDTWSTDVYGHNGGVPDATTQGPSINQIASEGGWLPGVAIKDPTPTNFLLDKGRAAVLNVDWTASGLYLGNGERADFVVDFTPYAGKTLIAYNDGGAPVPAADPRNEYFTGYGDNSATGGAEDTLAGYGPNSRTMMQIVVAPAVVSGSSAPITMSNLDAAVKTAYASSQERPIVAQSAYNGALGTAWDDSKAFATIFTGSIKQPTFDFVPGTPNSGFNSVLVQNGGDGYLTPPVVTFAPPSTPGGTTAEGEASLKISHLHVVNGGAGYRVAPTVTITSLNKGGGATATSSLGVSNVVVNTTGSGYTANSTITLTVSKPQEAGGVQAALTATIGSTGRVSRVNVVTAGSGYAAMPTITFPAPTGTGGVKATATAYGKVAALKLGIPDPTNPDTAGGMGYDNLLTDAADPQFAAAGVSRAGLTITMTAPPAAPANAGFTAATATAGASGKVFNITLTKQPVGYTSGSTVTVAAPPTADLSILTAATTVPKLVAATATAQTDTSAGTTLASYKVKTKAIQELFDPTYGRLNATFGVELPFTTALTQTTIPLGYVDQATEEFQDGETQIWKITHNGVDTHPIHFHLLNVQEVNRVGWDNFISPPEQNELGWKEVIKMSPLEDVIVALHAKKPQLRQSSADGSFAAGAGFGLPTSKRRQDPSLPVGAMDGFTQIDPNTGMPATKVNEEVDYGWEYVWHCHILGHEENDFMRPVVFHANEALPVAPTVNAPNGGLLTWTDNADTEYQYTVEYSTSATNNTWVLVANLPANSTQQSVSTVPSTAQRYRVTATGAAGSSSTIWMAPPAAPTNLAAGTATATTIALSWSDNSTNEAGFKVINTATGLTVATLAGSTNTGTRNVTVQGLTPNTSYTFQVVAYNDGGSVASVTPPTVTKSTSALTLASPNVTATSGFFGNPINLALAWPSIANAAGYDVQWSTNANMSSPTVLLNVTTSGNNNKLYTLAPSVTSGTVVYVQVRATNGAVLGNWSATKFATAR